ncbi:MAG: isoquinoline 1-oxidoreductase, partial [Rhodobacteraceae bacterium]|nr:isoquinoline 1-oxidoreductase [Paracoccaceae bacterium]
MERLRRYSRRAFLVSSAAVAGGVAFGVYAVNSPPDNPLLADRGEGEAVFNPWVRIDGSGITLITPHIDLGQGATHAQAVL